ncbi:hypothetical protein OQ279_01895 [Salinimicrobium sp. MT39]|uniref:DUF5017 domain-containing protein n=1 Tax=Salinimicrobium profundisediminis TaxID=2994553 RepID=A0A9X3CUM1_9FLAO|nr:hypothetical protein [Salinimicrobium profundisediminis]MCX2836890.1 hypothetical protein [Salinimicrobium profundisediminis]
MKKLVYLLMMVIGATFTSCEPMDDVHAEIDEIIATDPLVGILEYTLTEEDYTAMGLKNEYFASVDSANIEITEYLGETYPLWGSKSLASITANVANPLIEVDEAVEYTVTEEDYVALGFDFKNFDSADDMVRFLSNKFPDAETGETVELTYEYYSGSTNTETKRFVKAQNTWFPAVLLEKGDYNEMGQRYANFSNREDAENLLPNFLKLRFPYALEGEKRAVIYDLHLGGGKTKEILQLLDFNGLKWTTTGGVIEMLLQYGHNGEVWEPDNTIIYTLTPADYTLTGNGKYGNFNYWDQDDYDAAFENIITVLEARFPEAEIGQKFLVYFIGYAGAPATYSVNVIVNDEGEFVLNE